MTKLINKEDKRETRILIYDTKTGDKVKQKMHGYIMTVVSIEDSHRLFTTNEYVNIICRLDDGSTMKHNHKELLLVDESTTKITS